MVVVMKMMLSYQDKNEYSSLVGKEVKGLIPGSFINTLSKACGTLFRTYFKSLHFHYKSFGESDVLVHGSMFFL